MDALAEIIRAVVILSGGWVLFRLFPKLLTTDLVKGIEHHYKSRLEEIRGIISGHNLAFRSTVDFIIASHPKKIDKTFQAVENLLGAISKIEKLLGMPMTFQNLVGAPELRALFRGESSPVAFSLLNLDWQSVTVKANDALGECLNGTEILYVSTRLWLLHESVVRIYSRLALLTSTSLEKKKYQDWRTDSLMIGILENVLSTDQIQSAKTKYFGGLPNLVVEIKAEFVAECRSLVAGHKQLEEDVSEIADILKKQVGNPRKEDFGL